MDQTSPYSDMKSFIFEKILSDDGRHKTVALLGRFEGLSGGRAVVLLAKRHFLLRSIQQLFEGLSRLELQFQNDVYSKYVAAVPTDEGAINVDVIYPATEKHISKYTEQRYFMVQESPAEYAEVTKSFIESIPVARLQWVYNILEGKAEADRIICTDSDPDVGFALLVDQKWDQKQPEQLYLQVSHLQSGTTLMPPTEIVKSNPLADFVVVRDLRSLRNLTAEHLPLLQNIRTRCKRAVYDKYAIEAKELRLWLHYPPSYYHLHVHIAHTKWDGAGLQAGKAILLDDVMDNLAAIDGEYYKKRTMSFSVGENDPLLSAFSAQQ